MGITDSKSRPQFFNYGHSLIVTMMKFNYSEGEEVTGSVRLTVQNRLPPMNMVACLIGNENAKWNKLVMKKRKEGDEGPPQFKVIFLFQCLLYTFSQICVLRWFYMAVKFYRFW
jgi:hypothetical protein